MEKKNIAVIFGGRSSEHEISCISVITIINALDRAKYNPYLVGITREGTWLLVKDVADIENGGWQGSDRHAIISPDTKGELIIYSEEGGTYKDMENIRLDAAFPVLHGMYGEDGTIQGLFEAAGIPYVGCGVLASAAAMDKFYTKLIVDTLNVRQAKYVPVLKNELSDMDEVVARVEAGLDYPVFVKPSKSGSSKGVSKAENREALIAALRLAAEHDYKILVEETIVGRELECAVMGHDKTAKASGVGEILSAVEFYDYDAKYNSEDSKTVIDPELPDGVEAEIRDKAVKIFNAIDGFGLARVDFFMERDTNSVVFNEINTLPGFTSISMYPMLWAARGYDINKLVETLIDMAEERN